MSTNCDSLRHDLYHYFLDWRYDRRQALTNREKVIREFTLMLHINATLGFLYRDDCYRAPDLIC